MISPHARVFPVATGSMEMLHVLQKPALPEIPVVSVGASWPVETLEIALERAHALLDDAAAGCPAAVLKLGDAVSRRWLARWQSPYLGEIDRIATRIGRPGAHYFNVSYEWGCTTSAGHCPERRSARLMRVLDWPNHGLGRHIMAARVAAKAGPFATLTWPGFTGVLQAMAPGRFAAAFNQPPMAQPVRLLPLDWAINRARVWRMPHLTPAHLLRRVFETARTYAEARRMLTDTPIAVPAIYSLSGVAAHEACIIERKEDEAHVIDGPATAANEWQRPGWSGRARSESSAERQRLMARHDRALDDSFAWLEPPIRNDFTRLALVADAAAGRLVAQGFEADGPATRVLSLTC